MREGQAELRAISNTCYSRANRNSFYNKQKTMFEKNIKCYGEAALKEMPVHRHVQEITDMYKNLYGTSKPIR